jgi:hypothetical protein
VTFTGTAHSVDFGGTVNQVGFDNITLGSGTPGGGGGGPPPAPAVPLPALSPAMLAALVVLLGFVAFAWRRSRQR